VILGGGVAVCILLSAHRAVIFAIAQLSCIVKSSAEHYRDEAFGVARPKPAAAAESSACGIDNAVGLTSILD